MNYQKNFIHLFLINFFIFLLFNFLGIICLKTFIKFFFDLRCNESFCCNESIIKLNDKIYIMLF